MQCKQKDSLHCTHNFNSTVVDKNASFLPVAEETGCDASRAASARQVLQDLSDHVGQQRRHHQQTICRHSSAQGNVIIFTLHQCQCLLKQTVVCQLVLAQSIDS